LNRKSVILINPFIQYQTDRNARFKNRRKVPRHYPPVNLLQIGGLLKQAGIKVHILDCYVEPNPFSFIDRICTEEDVIFVGVTVKMAPLITIAQVISYYVKSNYPEVFTVWGGMLPTILPDEVLREAYVDYVVVGQGEESALALAEALASGKTEHDIPGVGRLDSRLKNEIVLTPQKSDIREYNADWSLIAERLQAEQRPYYAGTVTTRGCMFQCSFCYLTALDNSMDHLRVWYERPIDMVMHDVDSLKAHGMNVFTFQDDCFLTSPKRVFEMFDAFADREIYVEQCVTAVRTITEEVIERIHPYVQTIGYSIETVNQDLQKILGKPVPTDVFIKANELLYRYDINSSHNIIFGIPGETDDDIRDNIDLCAHLRGINPYTRFAALYCVPYPKSRLEGWVKENLNMWIPWDLRLISTIDLSNLKVNPAYQPWLKDPDLREFYEDVMAVFEALFSPNRSRKDPQVVAALEKKRIRRLFENALELPPYPKNPPYILDHLLAHSDIPYPQAKFSLKS